MSKWRHLPLCVAYSMGLLGLAGGGVHAAECVNIVPDSLHDSVAAPRGTSGIGGTGLSPKGGIGGTGITPTGGIGGTGHSPTGGIGGTGSAVDLAGDETVVLGMITGFASICVNGLEIHYDPATPVSRNGQPASQQQMAVGQVVAVKTEPTAKGLVTRRIAILNAVEGAARTDSAPLKVNDSINVQGQQVRITAQTGGNVMGAAIRRGEALAVSGYRNSQGEVVATRIDRMTKLEQPSVLNERQLTELLGKGRQVVVESIVRRAANGQLDLGVVRVNLNAATKVVADSTQIQPDQRVRVVGRLDKHGHIVADRVDVQKQLPAVPAGAAVANDDKNRQSKKSASHSVSDDEANADNTSSGSNSSGSNRLEKAVEAEQELREDLAKAQEDYEKEQEEIAEDLAKTREKGAEELEKLAEDSQKAREKLLEERQKAQEKLREQQEKLSETSRENREQAQRVEKAERNESKTDKVDKLDKVEKTDKLDKPEKAEKVEKAEKPEKVEKAEKPEKVEKPEKAEKSEKVEKPDKVEKPEKLEKPEKVERPDKIDKSGKD